jgi:hypothetical protein
MGIRFGLRSQIILVVALFVASLAVLLSSSLATVWMPGREEQARKELSAASRRMAEEAAQLPEDAPAKLGKKPPPDWHNRLEEITRRSLADLWGVEGGFYLAGNWNQYTGYAFPNNPVVLPEPPPSDEPPPPLKGKGKEKGKGKAKAEPPSRRDPPPNEKRFVTAQCRASLDSEPDAPPSVLTTQIGPSRVMIVTEPVGRERPALMATWVMTRLTRPEQLAADVHRNQAAAGLALAGVLVALLLAANLGRNLRLERRQREQLREELRHSEHLASLGKFGNTDCTSEARPLRNISCRLLPIAPATPLPS